MRTRFVWLVMCAAALSAAPAVASASGSQWNPVGLARKVVVANLKNVAPGFPVSLGSATCSGRMTGAHCTINASVSNDDVTAKVSFTRHRDGSHITYRDTLTLVAVSGGGTVTRRYYGKIFT